MSPTLTDAELMQRTDARKAALIARWRRQLQRLENEVRQVREKLSAAGVKVIVPSGRSTGLQANEETCSTAGALLRACAERRARQRS